MRGACFLILIVAAPLASPVPAAAAGHPARAARAPAPSSGAARPPPPPALPAALCSGEYADEATALLERVREYERDPANQYSYCLRTTAVYECLSYGSDGTVRRTRRSSVAHGTGFAYRRSGGDTLLATNDHVASWPAVTDDQHPVDDVPAGCKLVSDAVKIVDDESDDYEPNDVPLQRVVSDPALDVAVLKTRAPLKLIPYKVGRSAALRVGNAVAVHGFPLGAFAATNGGKVVNAFDHDTDKDWDHVDFVVDALLSPGNSGSPVLAVSCRTGEFELVGIYHAGYVRGSALNVVIGIDQARDLLTTLRRSPHPTAVDDSAAGLRERALVSAALAGPGRAAFFPFGPLVAQARALPSGALAFEVWSRGFPLRDERLLVLEDLPSPDGFGAPGHLFLGNERGLRPWEVAALDNDAQAQLQRVLARLRAGAAATLRFRGADASSSKGHKDRAAVEREITRAGPADRDAAQALVDLAERLGPRLGDTALAYREVAAQVEAAPAAPTTGTSVAHEGPAEGAATAR